MKSGMLVYIFQMLIAWMFETAFVVAVSGAVLDASDGMTS